MTTHRPTVTFHPLTIDDLHALGRQFRTVLQPLRDLMLTDAMGIEFGIPVERRPYDLTQQPSLDEMEAFYQALPAIFRAILDRGTSKRTIPTDEFSLALSIEVLGAIVGRTVAEHGLRTIAGAAAYPTAHDPLRTAPTANERIN